ncbi:MAG: class II aldolase/adducin family protein [Muribaculaceae bacterium]|nr:class II aldolase/adducin family protein [Muribaculaceae bacterium]
MATIKQIEEFVACAHKVGQCGLTICSSGNLSIRIGDEVLVSGTGSWVPDLTPDNVSVVNFADGKVLNGIKPSMESVFHLGVLRERAPEVNCVLHFQSPYATTVACMKNRPENFNFTAECPIHVGREIPMIPYYRPGSPELASHVIEAMKEHDSVMLLKHGQVVCGKDFKQALERAMFFEMACRIAVLNGNNVDPLTEEEIKDLDVYILGKVK